MESGRAATAVCSLPHAPRACPGRDFLLRKSGKPDLRWGRVGEGGRSYCANCIRQALPPPPTPPHKGRAIAYGFAPVVFARIKGKPSRCRHTATESNPEQNRIQCGTTELPLRSDPSRKVKYGRNFSICDSPAHKGEGSTPSARDLFRVNSMECVLAGCTTSRSACP
jgi:hypothetical protein